MCINRGRMRFSAIFSIKEIVFLLMIRVGNEMLDLEPENASLFEFMRHLSDKKQCRYSGIKCPRAIRIMH